MITKKWFTVLTLLLFAQVTLQAQDADTLSSKKKKKAQELESTQVIAPEPSIATPPTIGFGLGVLTYYGEVSRNYRTNNPVMSRIAYNLYVNQPLNRFLSGEITALYGQVAANERSATRNLNFQSTIAGLGVGLIYNFDHILKEDRIVEPYIGVGLKFIDFNSKTDLKDEYGNEYNYWSDGTIRNLPENAPNRELAVRIQRNYQYETDIRKKYENELGLYNEYTIAIPISAGVNMHVTERWKLRMGATFIYTFTDNIDGVSKNATGSRRGDASNDHLLNVNVGLSYNLTRPKREKKFENNDAFEDIEDMDGDGVPDFRDLCMGTPPGVEVDAQGCPLDDDKDLVGNYKDQELESPPGSIVDSVGVSYTDERLYNMYLAFMDTTGKYSPIENESYTISVIGARTSRKRSISGTNYAVQVGEYENSIPSDLVSSLLNINDVGTYKVGNKIIVAVGKYKTIEEANKKRSELDSQGTSTQKIISIDASGNIKAVDSRVSNDLAGGGASGGTSTGSSTNVKDSKGSNNAGKPNFISNAGVAHFSKDALPSVSKYRVQLGAFSREANEKYFKGLDNVIAVSSDDGFTRYYSGVFDNYQDAARYKVDMVQRGFTNAFVIKVQGSGLEQSSSRKGSLNDLPPGTKLTEEQKTKLKFKVQVGSFRNPVSSKAMDKFNQIGFVQIIDGDDGMKKYLVGEFVDYNTANELKNQLRNEGYNGAFVVAEYQGEIVRAAKALELIK